MASRVAPDTAYASDTAYPSGSVSGEARPSPSGGRSESVLAYTWRMACTWAGADAAEDRAGNHATIAVVRLPILWKRPRCSGTGESARSTEAQSSSGVGSSHSKHRSARGVEAVYEHVDKKHNAQKEKQKLAEVESEIATRRFSATSGKGGRRSLIRTGPTGLASNLGGTANV